MVPISHLSSLCLLDRALKHNFPKARTKHVADTRKLCIDALKRGDLEPVTIDRLAHVRAEAVPELRRRIIESHTCPHQLGPIAQEAGVNRLALTHMSAMTDAPWILDVLSDSYHGEVILGEDLLRIEV